MAKARIKEAEEAAKKPAAPAPAPKAKSAPKKAPAKKKLFSRKSSKGDK
tara:strand:+ start:714 stop:860 length:147 start_codon:yes stop_codon:yes gene_type:complete